MTKEPDLPTAYKLTTTIWSETESNSEDTDQIRSEVWWFYSIEKKKARKTRETSSTSSANSKEAGILWSVTKTLLQNHTDTSEKPDWRVCKKLFFSKTWDTERNSSQVSFSSSATCSPQTEGYNCTTACSSLGEDDLSSMSSDRVRKAECFSLCWLRSLDVK